MDAGLDLVSGRKPPDAVDTEFQEPARARGEVVSSMDMDFDGRVAGLRCCDVLLLSVFSARAAIVVSVTAAGMLVREERKQAHSLSGTVFCNSFDATQAVQQRRSANATRR